MKSELNISIIVEFDADSEEDDAVASPSVENVVLNADFIKERNATVEILSVDEADFFPAHFADEEEG